MENIWYFFRDYLYQSSGNQLLSLGISVISSQINLVIFKHLYIINLHCNENETGSRLIQTQFFYNYIRGIVNVPEYIIMKSLAFYTLTLLFRGLLRSTNYGFTQKLKGRYAVLRFTQSNIQFSFIILFPSHVSVLKTIW